MTEASKPAIAFIGLGIMGSAMAANLHKAGYPLHLSTRTPSKAASLVAGGAILHDDPGSAAAEAGIVITMVGLPADVEEIYLGNRGIIARAKPGALLIDMDHLKPFACPAHS